MPVTQHKKALRRRLSVERASRLMSLLDREWRRVADAQHTRTSRLLMEAREEQGRATALLIEAARNTRESGRIERETRLEIERATEQRRLATIRLALGEEAYVAAVSAAERDRRVRVIMGVEPPLPGEGR